MFVIVVYDVNVKRTNKVLKICRKYLIHIQRSVFEGTITEAKLQKLKSELVYCITDISPNNLYKFSSAALSSIDVATATPHSSAVQTENLSCVI